MLAVFVIAVFAAVFLVTAFFVPIMVSVMIHLLFGKSKIGRQRKSRHRE